MLVHQPRGEVRRRHALDRHIGDRTAPRRVARCIEHHARDRARTRRPVLLQPAQPFLLARRADPLMERDRVLDAEVGVTGNRSRVVELSDVVIREPVITVDRPELRDPVPLHIQDACAERDAEPLVQGGAVVVRAGVGNAIVELRERVRAIDHHVHTTRVRHLGHFPHRQHLAREVHHMTDHEQARPRGDRIGVRPHHGVVALRVQRDVHHPVHHPVAPRLQLELVDHRAVVMRGVHRFVTGLPVDARDHRVEGLGGVARDDQFIGTAAGHRGESRLHARLVRPHDRAHVVRRLGVEHPHMSDEGLEHRLRLHRVVAALEIDVLGAQTIAGADRIPERFVARERTGRDTRHAGREVRRDQESEGSAPERAEELALLHGQSRTWKGGGSTPSARRYTYPWPRWWTSLSMMYSRMSMAGPWK